MITMKEQADQFRKLLHHMNAPKKTTNKGFAIPYENLANARVEFAPSECYSFFGGQGANTLSYWKTNLLLKLLKKGISVCVLEGGDTFRRDKNKYGPWLMCLCHHLGTGRREDYYEYAFDAGLNAIDYVGTEF